MLKHKLRLKPNCILVLYFLMFNILCRPISTEKEREKWRKTESKRKRVKEMEVTGNIDRETDIKAV